MVEPVEAGAAVVVFEFEEYPEPKVLGRIELEALCLRYGRFQTVADIIGASEAFVRQSVRPKFLSRRRAMGGCPQ